MPDSSALAKGCQVDIAFDDADSVPCWIPATVDYVHGDKVGATLHGGGSGIWRASEVRLALQRKWAADG